jgi:Icc-related predicted phosphoesterase
MLVISDVHHALGALQRVVSMGERLLILGDLVNLSDYRTGEGAVAEVLGVEFARRSAASRAAGDYEMMRGLWREAVGDDAVGFRSAIGEAINAQYGDVNVALEGARGYVIHGNVDRPRHLEEALPEGLEYVHGKVVEIDGVRVGFAGGGVATPLQAEGEVSDDEMTELLDGLGSVDVLCTHVPPAIPALRTDVITGRSERGSEPILRYLEKFKPRLHLFGDVHQPQASTWRVGKTLCRNVGYFRATGRPIHLDLSRFG